MGPPTTSSPSGAERVPSTHSENAYVPACASGVTRSVSVLSVGAPVTSASSMPSGAASPGVAANATPMSSP